MTETHERLVDVGGGSRVWSCASGTGEPLLLFNGGPGCDDYLAPVAAMLEHRCRVVRFEPRGCGRSSWDGRYDVKTIFADADAVRSAYGISRCICAGHSFGASAALAYALDYPGRARAVIGIAGGNFVNDRTWSEAYHKGLDEVGEDYGGVEFKADPRANAEGNRTWRNYIKRPALWRDLADLTVPATFISGTEDIRPDWPTRQLAALLPNGRFVEIPGAEHVIWLTHAAALRTELLRALPRPA